LFKPAPKNYNDTLLISFFTEHFIQKKMPSEDTETNFFVPENKQPTHEKIKTKTWELKATVNWNCSTITGFIVILIIIVAIFTAPYWISIAILEKIMNIYEKFDNRTSFVQTNSSYNTNELPELYNP